MISTVDLRRDGAVDSLRRACEELGFFTVTGHGVDEELVRAVADASRAFFDSPDAEKARYASPAEIPGLPVYRPLRSERLGATGDGVVAADLKESLDWGPTLEGVAWPPGLEELYTAYLAAMHTLARRLRGLVARALERHEAWFEDRFDEQASSLRVINYPDPDAPPTAGQVRAGAHRDYGFLTILRGDDAPGGLEVQTLAGAWVPVRPDPGAFVCNIGDLLAEWTGGSWTSTLHRVSVPPPDAAVGSRRQSLVFFHNPRADAYLDELGLTSGDYILRKAAAAFGTS
jgi:isopenicillin N synthase-like dioxygenase